MRRTMLACVAVLLMAAPLYAQNPCTAAAPTGVFFNPDKVFVQLSEYNTMEADGTTPRVTDYEIAWFAQGANPATATPAAGPVVIPKATFTLVAGTTDCYTMTPLNPPVPAGSTPLVGHIRARRAASGSIPAGQSVWSIASNSFAVAPTVLVAPGPMTIRR